MARPRARTRTTGTDAEILKLFYEIEELTRQGSREARGHSEQGSDRRRGGRGQGHRRRARVRAAFQSGGEADRRTGREQDSSVVDTTVDDGIVIKCMKKDPTKNEEEALKDIYRRLRPGDPPTAANARALIKRLFFDPKRYDLGRVGRYKINQKLGHQGRRRFAHPDQGRPGRRDQVSAPPEKGRRHRWTISITWAAAASAPWANCSPTNAASAWPAPNVWSRSA